MVNKIVEFMKEYDKRERENSLLNPEFKKVLDLLENTNHSYFVTGKAGTGKSTLLKFFKDTTKKKAVVLAPTGLSALNVDGQTIHSFFKFPPRIINDKDIKKVNSRIYEELNCLIIDEVSMVRADLMDGIDKFLRKNRNNSRPFEGVQVLFFGDLFQLPPVTNEETEILNFTYETPYFFSAKAVLDADLKLVELENVYRQQEKDFIQLLDNIRKGNNVSGSLAEINKRVVNDFVPDNDCVILTPTNYNADMINNQRLSRLPGSEKNYLASAEGSLKNQKHNLPVNTVLKLKTGARVIFTRNDSGGSWVNGTLGTIIELDRDVITVKLDKGGSVFVERVVWEKVKYSYNEKNDKIVTETTGKLVQFPLKLAWALTIHKSQGQTFEKVFIDMNTGAFAHGQTYVALSRCRTLNGIILKKPISINDVIIDKVVADFFKK